MAENDVDYLDSNNTDCTVEKGGVYQRGVLTVDPLTESTLSHSKDGQVVTSYADNYGVKGNGFTLQRNFAIASGASLYILIDYTTFTKPTGFIFVQPPIFSAGAGEVLVNVYRGSDYSGGSVIEVLSNNTVINNTMETTITENPTGTVLGDSVLEYLVGSKSTNQNSGGGSISIGPPFIRNNTGKTLVEIVNNSGENTTFNYSQVFFEI
ncbi:MAG: hypothetical protein GY804_11965 [Alphaproteobacteria bacterium]|nr:hypothetical protein [Alphaproteobacteria bacterium]